MVSGPASLDAFRGLWSLSRQIDDRAAGYHATLEGQAEFVADDPGLILTERGYLRLPGQAPLWAERRYLWVQDGPGRIAVRFADGRAFHGFAVEAGAAQAAHWCDPDAYAVTYDFSTWPDWRSHWTVKGPRKDYDMTSLYRPLPG